MSNRNRAVCAAFFLAATHAAFAQNLVENPSFDADTSGWTTTAFSIWSNAANHGAGDGGSLEISTTTADSARQCIDVNPSQRYDLSAWIAEDQSSGVRRPCSAPIEKILIEWQDDFECEGRTIFSEVLPSPFPIPQDWYGVSESTVSPPMAHSIFLTLDAECASQDGTAAFYFDDIVFVPDSIFKNDFELHAGETGPEQPGG